MQAKRREPTGQASVPTEPWFLLILSEASKAQDFEGSSLLGAHH